MSRKNFLKIVSIVCLSCLPYISTLRGDFVFDDSEAVVNNKDVTSDNWLDCFYNDFWGSDIRSNLSHKSYRPLTILTFRLNYYLNFKTLSAYGFKSTNLLCHVLCTVLVYLAIKDMINTLNPLLKKRDDLDMAYITSLLFAVHPIHTEAVCGIVGRADLLAGATFFLVIIFYNKSMTMNTHKNFNLGIAMILAGMSLLLKENGITVLGFCLCYDIVTKLYLKDKHNKLDEFKFNHFLIRALVTLFSIVLFLYLRWNIMGASKPTFSQTDNPAAFSKDIFTRVFTYSYLYFLNALLLIWPHWLCYDWSMGSVPLVTTILDYRIIFSIFPYIFLMLVVIAVFKTQNKNLPKSLLLVALVLTALPFLPASNIFYPVGFVIAERILYIPSAGYCLFVAIGFNKLFKRKNMYKTAVFLFSLLIFFYGLKCLKRSLDWRNEYQLFVSAVSVCPLNAKVHYNVAKALDAKNMTNLAIAEYKEAIRLYPEYYQAMNNLGNLLKSKKSFNEAEFYLRSAVTIKKDFPAAWMNLGIVLAAVDKFNESETAYKTALTYRKIYPDCHYNMGNLYLELNRTEEAMKCWQHAVNLDPTHILAWTNLLAFLDNNDLKQH
nr:protein O-mannosyl-transferase TMTC4-like isoform X2 [Plodia interpunctella]